MVEIETAHAHARRVERFFNMRQWALFALLVLVGVSLRWFDLDSRPFHHDESLHGMYGKYFFDFPDHNYYKYSPMLHGPFLYNLYRVVYNTLGQGDFASRAPIAFVGTLFIFLPLVFRSFLSRWGVLALTAAVALSPTLIYWARFLREDTLIVGCMAAMLYGVCCARGPLKALWFLLALTLQFCIKENAYVTLAILIGYVLFEFCFNRFVLHHGETMVSELIRYARRYVLALASALAVCVFIYCYFYSAGFRYSQGILDGVYRESISYWMHHHNIERISGPFLFHFYILSWYESAFVILFLVHLWTFYSRASRNVQIIAGAALLLALVLGVSSSTTTLVSGNNSVPALQSWSPTDINFPFWRFLKLKDGYDVFGAIILLLHPVLLTVTHLIRDERNLAFFGYLFTATFFSYSYLGEKVPWLSVYPFVCGLVYFALYFDRLLRQNPIPNFTALSSAVLLRRLGYCLLVLGFVFTAEGGDVADTSWMLAGVVFVAASLAFARAEMLSTYNARSLAMLIFLVFTTRAAFLTNFVYAGDAREYISQVHTTREFHNIANAIKAEIDNELRGYRPQVCVLGEATWPATWYFRDYTEYKFAATPAELAKFNYIIQDWKEGDQNPSIPPGFRAMRINLRGWWVPDFRQMTLKRFLGYALNHTPWSPVGFSYVNLLVKPRD